MVSCRVSNVPWSLKDFRFRGYWEIEFLERNTIKRNEWERQKRSEKNRSHKKMYSVLFFRQCNKWTVLYCDFNVSIQFYLFFSTTHLSISQIKSTNVYSIWYKYRLFAVTWTQSVSVFHYDTNVQLLLFQLFYIEYGFSATKRAVKGDSTKASGAVMF